MKTSPSHLELCMVEASRDALEVMAETRRKNGGPLKGWWLLLKSLRRLGKSGAQSLSVVCCNGGKYCVKCGYVIKLY